MAVGGGPSPEQYAKMTKAQKTGYWIAVVVVFGFIGALFIKKIFF
ncbi:hypothetical protein PPMP20_15935 [Paraburkholderia phymatum]|nr:hypothetical protein [Paraburkholderia phymatum]